MIMVSNHKESGNGINNPIIYICCIIDNNDNHSVMNTNGTFNKEDNRDIKLHASNIIISFCHYF